MNALALALLTTFGATPAIDLAIVERTGQSTALLTVLKADPRIHALCLDLEGLTNEELAAAQRDASARPLWLYLGPRRIARGHISKFDSAASAFGPCTVTAEAQFEDAVPLASRSDVLWASTTDFGSQPNTSLPSGVAERARLALPAALGEACLRPSAVTRRGTGSGTYVNLVCESAGKPTSALVFLPAQGAPRVILMDDSTAGQLTLVDVLATTARSGTTMVLARQVEGGRRLELWDSDGTQARPVESWPY